MGTTRTGREAVESGAVLPLPDSLPNVLFWIIFVLFLPVVLVSLGDRRLEEVENSLLQLSPILSTGFVILVFFWVALRVVQRILTRGGRAANRKLPLGSNELPGGQLGILVFFWVRAQGCSADSDPWWSCSQSQTTLWVRTRKREWRKVWMIVRERTACPHSPKPRRSSPSDRTLPPKRY